MSSYRTDEGVAAGQWRFYGFGDNQQLFSMVAYRPGEYVYCQRGSDDGILARAQIGRARHEVPDDPRQWDDLATYRAVLFGVMNGKGAGRFDVGIWGSSTEALEGVVDELACYLDDESEVTTFRFPSQELSSRRVHPDPSGRRERDLADAAASQAAAEERAGDARRTARRQAQERVIGQAEADADVARQRLHRLRDTETVTEVDLLAAFEAAGEGPPELAEWGTAIIGAMQRWVDAHAVDGAHRILFDVLRDAAAGRYQGLSPFEGVLEAPREVNEAYQGHAEALEHLARVRGDVLSDLLEDLTWRFMKAVDALTWGELARFGAVRERPPVARRDLDEY